MSTASTAATGIADWNYIDYVKVYGSPDLQAAALPSGTRAVVYVPERDANGATLNMDQKAGAKALLLKSAAAATAW